MAVLDEAGQSTEALAITSNGLAAMGMGPSVLSRLHASPGPCDHDDVLLGRCHEVHPSLLQWASDCFYDGPLPGGPTDPAKGRDPCSEDSEQACAARGSPPDSPTLGADKWRNPAHGAQLGGHLRVLLAHTDSAEASCNHVESTANIREAAVVCDSVAAAAPDLIARNKQLFVITGYRASMVALRHGHPLRPGAFLEAYHDRRQGKSTGKGSTPPSTPRGGRGGSPGPCESAYRQRPTQQNGLLHAFSALEARCPDLSAKNIVSISSVDGCQGDKAALVIFFTTPAIPTNEWGFMDDARRTNVAMTRAQEGLIVVMNGKMRKAVGETQFNTLADWVLDASAWLDGHTAFDHWQLQNGWADSAVSPAETKAILAEGKLKAWFRQKRKAREQQALGFATVYDTPLPDNFDGDGLGDDLAAGVAALLADPAFFPVLNYVLGLHQHLHGLRGAPANLHEHSRKLVSHDGYLFDLERGVEKTNYVYTATWTRLAYMAGLQATCRDARVAPEHRQFFQGPDGQPLPSAWAMSSLVMILFVVCEPKPPNAPYSKPGQIGDVLERILLRKTIDSADGKWSKAVLNWTPSGLRAPGSRSVQIWARAAGDGSVCIAQYAYEIGALAAPREGAERHAVGRPPAKGAGPRPQGPRAPPRAPSTAPGWALSAPQRAARGRVSRRCDARPAGGRKRTRRQQRSWANGATSGALRPEANPRPPPPRVLQRWLMPIEALALQGFPLGDELLRGALSGLSDQDVLLGAGNAMSVPVVAAVLADVLAKTGVGRQGLPPGRAPSWEAPRGETWDLSDSEEDTAAAGAAGPGRLFPACRCWLHLEHLPDGPGRPAGAWTLHARGRCLLLGRRVEEQACSLRGQMAAAGHSRASADSGAA
ncbi:unnamed protein product [Prorocentrum cordatum]|uniref:DNA2/NAM7 helicase-like C-terminal domain-containing protein n=1 Tax=Prorocentrum cordatum TaxID=2364126 RepID=A0ABN9T8Z2_9DINO|nr:unnamed protein product [Polarella glacialis]